MGKLSADQDFKIVRYEKRTQGKDAIYHPVITGFRPALQDLLWQLEALPVYNLETVMSKRAYVLTVTNDCLASSLISLHFFS